MKRDRHIMTAIGVAYIVLSLFSCIQMNRHHSSGIKIEIPMSKQHVEKEK